MKKLFDNKDWKSVSLGNEEHFEMIMGQSPPSEFYNKEKNGLPFLQGNADFGPINPTPQIYCSSPIKIAKKSDVLISVRAPVGEVNIAKEDYCIGRGLGAIRSKKEVNHEFLFYCLLNSKQQLDSISGGSTFKAVTKNQLEKFRISLPPIHEQKKIAEKYLCILNILRFK
jgi:type I restriction enzyme S subunit